MKNSLKNLSITALLITNAITSLSCSKVSLKSDARITDSSISIEIEKENESIININDKLLESTDVINSTLLSTIEEIKKNRKMVALTFDDGPSKNTEELLELLNKYNVDATFFVLEYNCINYPDAIISMAEQGHEIAIHGSTHTAFTKLTVEEVQNEITSTINTIENLGVEASNIVRPPYGSLNTELKENITSPFVLWSIDTEDWKSRDKDLIKKQIEDSISDGQIILMHDMGSVHNANLEALRELLPELTKEYAFVTISDLYKYNDIELENGGAYSKIKNPSK